MKPYLAFLGVPLALVFILGMYQACTQASQATTAGVVTAFNCETSSIDPAALADAETFASARVQAWLSGTTPPDLATLKATILADLTPVKSNLGRCAIAGALAAIAAVAAPTPGVSALTAGPDPVMVRAAFSSAARELRWAPVRVGGAIL